MIEPPPGTPDSPGTSGPAPRKAGERMDDLQRRGFRIIQSPALFRFGTDSVLLADFARVRGGERCVDLCCGAGAVGLLLLARQADIQVCGVEIQPEAADLARRNVALNGLGGRFSVHEGDICTAHEALGKNEFTLAVCNPPYHKAGAALGSADPRIRIARHAGELTAGEIALAAARLIQSGGRFAVIYPAPRALEMLRALEDAGIAPKRLRTVHGVADRPPGHILIEGIKGAKAGLHWLAPLCLRDSQGQYTQEYRRIYNL